MISCKDCGKDFEHRDSMEQHYSMKHAKHVAPKVVKKSSKKPIFMVVGIVIVLLTGYFMFFTGDSSEKPLITDSGDIEINLEEVPNQPIHWHPKVAIVINGEPERIPANVGAVSSSHGIGINHAPVHTHDATGTLHMEMRNPTPETVTLGYFFHEVWKRAFNSTCIFEYCNGEEGTVSMLVNGKQNFQFDKYIAKDNDDIKIVFE